MSTLLHDDAMALVQLVHDHRERITPDFARHRAHVERLDSLARAFLGGANPVVGAWPEGRLLASIDTLVKKIAAHGSTDANVLALVRTHLQLGPRA